MIKYQRNNIIFRIASADAIGKFKAAQAHSFIQVARKELAFDEAAKEAVLLEFDRFSQWIFRIERICLAAGEGHVPAELKLAIYESFSEELRIIEGVMEGHPDVFSRDVLQFTKLIHTYASSILEDMFEESMLACVDEAYSNIVRLISGYLQHFLIAMHEFNNNIIKKKELPFICASDFSVEVGNENQFVPCATRAKYFQEKLGTTDFTFKNYSVVDIFDAVKLHFSELGLSLHPEKEIVNQEVQADHVLT